VHELTVCQLLQVLWVGGLFANIAACTIAAIFLFLPSLRLYGVAILTVQVIHFNSGCGKQHITHVAAFMLRCALSWYCSEYLADPHDIVEAAGGSHCVPSVRTAGMGPACALVQYSAWGAPPHPEHDRFLNPSLCSACKTLRSAASNQKQLFVCVRS